jgi:hypothetical protein
MNLKSKIIFLTILIHFLFVPFGTNGWPFQENPLTKAIQLFDKEKFAEAEPFFKEILDKRPDDFMVNYFYGACRTENGNYSTEDLNYLLKASKEVNPLNIDYYLAIQYHAKNQWEKALAYYKLYKSTSSANEQEKVGLALKMEQCTNKVNPFVSNAEELTSEDSRILENNKVEEISVAQLGANQVGDSVNTTIHDTTNFKEDEPEMTKVSDSTNQIIENEQLALLDQSAVEESVNETVKAIPANERIKFSVNNEIIYLALSNFKTDEGRNYFDEGTASEKELEKVMIRTEILRDKYKSAQSRTERDSLGQLILSLEGEAYDLKNSVTSLFMQAKTSENGYWANASTEETERFIKELNLSSRITNTTAEMPETNDIIIPQILIQDEQAKTAAAKAGDLGVTYKIQIGAYSRGIPSSLKSVFNKISILRKVENYTDENGVVVYTTGNLTNYDDAVVMQKQVKQEGIKDPIIAAYFNGKRITLDQAKEIDNNQ